MGYLTAQHDTPPNKIERYLAIFFVPPYKMTTHEKTYLWPLRAEGYFVSIIGSPEPDTYEVECTLYITDRDEFGATTLLRHNPSTSTRDDENECVACAAKDDMKREFKRGAVTCPLCGEWTKPWEMRKFQQRGTFKLAPEGVSFVKGVGAKLPPNVDEMRSEHVIHCISEALREGYEVVGSTLGGGGF